MIVHCILNMVYDFGCAILAFLTMKPTYNSQCSIYRLTYYLTMFSLLKTHYIKKMFPRIIYAS